jgi:chromosome segregation ATPase
MSRPVVFVVFVAAIVTSGAFVARVPAQQPASIQTELLAEVRLLRQSIEMLTGTNARVQIVFGRLQLQEQRTESALKRLDAARLALNAMNTRVTDLASRLKYAENALNDSRRKPDELQQLQEEFAHTRREIERLEVERARLIQDEQDAAAVLNQEQGRWADLNRQLDELERILSPRQQ